MRRSPDRDGKPRIAFIINSLAGGGAERVFCRVIEGLKDRLKDCEAEIVLLDDEPIAYPPPDFLRTRILDASRGLPASVTELARELVRFRPHVAVSFLSRANCANVIASRLCGYHAVISERVATADHFGRGPVGRLKHAITAAHYRQADTIIAVSEGVRQGLVHSCGVRPDRIVVVSNPIDAQRIGALAAQAADASLPERFIVSVNRLMPKKNVLLQLEALRRSGLPHHLVILGDGPERGAIAARADALDLGDRVHLMGFAANPFAIMARAEMFLSTSNAEGFPNALAEAMALGVPCVSTNCPAGPAEILADDPSVKINEMYPAVFGVLTPVGDAQACAEALRYLVQPQQRAHYSRMAAERAGMYSPERTIEGYWRVISRAAGLEARPPTSQENDRRTETQNVGSALPS